MIDVRDLHFAYPDGRVALDGLTLNAAPGGICRPHRAHLAGKTTLFLCSCGVLRSRSGSIRVAGLDPADATRRKQLPAHVGVVFQNSDDQLFSSTVGEDVAFGPFNLQLPADEVHASRGIPRQGRNDWQDARAVPPFWR